MTPRRLIAWTLALAALLPGLPARAAEEDPDEQPRPSDLEERVAVRAALPDDEDVAAFATTIEVDKSRDRGEDLAELLRRVPGARVRDYGGLGSYATVSLRASTAEQVTVLVDGVPQNRALGGPVDLSSIPVTQLERVTVFRGFGPAGLGLGGIGGVVDVRTRRPAEHTEGQLDLLAGELGTARISTGWSFRAGRGGAIRLGGEALAGDGDFRFLDTAATPFDREDDRWRARRNGDVEHGTLLLQGSWDAVGPGRLTLATRVQRRDRGVPGLDSLPADRTRLDESLDDLGVSWSWRGSGRTRGLDLWLDGFEQRVRFHDPEGELGPVQDRHTRLDGGGVAMLLDTAAGAHRVRTRLDVRRERARVADDALELSDRGGARRHLLLATIEDQLARGRWVVAPSLRLEHRRDDFRSGADGTIPPPASDVAETRLAGKLGVAFAVDARTSIRGSAGRFHRSPSLVELFGDRGAVVGNPALRSERGVAAELGVARRWPGDRLDAAVEVVAFARDTDDLILFLPNSQGTAVARNVAGAKVRGLETHLTLDGPAGFGLHAGGTLQRAVDDSGTAFDGKPLVYQPERSGFLGVTWSRERLRAGWDVTYVGENSTTRLDDPELRLAARVIHDVTLGVEWPNGLRLGLDARNVFDRRVRDVARYPLPGRVLLLHLGWSAGPR